MHLGKNAASCKTVIKLTQERDLEVTDSSVKMSVECSAAVRKKKVNGMLDIIRKGRDNKTESLRSDLTEWVSSKWKEKVEGYNGDK